MNFTADANLANLLRRVHLGGKIEEVKLEVDQSNAGTAFITAIDISNSVFVSGMCQLKGKVQPGAIGITRLDLLTKFMEASGAEEVELSTDDRFLKATRKGHGSVKCQLLAVDQVPTAVAKPDEAETRMQESATHELPFLTTERDKLLYYLTLVGVSSVVIEAKNGTVEARSLDTVPEQFNCSIGGLKQGKGDAKTEVYAEFLAAVLKVAKWSNEDAALLKFSNGGPVLVELDGCFWAVTPVA